jgi:hypothetical protein
MPPQHFARAARRARRSRTLSSVEARALAPAAASSLRPWANDAGDESARPPSPSVSPMANRVVTEPSRRGGAASSSPISARTRWSDGGQLTGQIPSNSCGTQCRARAGAGTSRVEPSNRRSTALAGQRELLLAMARCRPARDPQRELKCHPHGTTRRLTELISCKSPTSPQIRCGDEEPSSTDCTQLLIFAHEQRGHESHEAVAGARARSRDAPAWSRGARVSSTPSRHARAMSGE